MAREDGVEKDDSILSAVLDAAEGRVIQVALVDNVTGISSGDASVNTLMFGISLNKISMLASD
jgi:hypothetical protein